MERKEEKAGDSFCSLDSAGPREVSSSIFSASVCVPLLVCTLGMCCLGAVPSRLIPSLVLLLVPGRLWFSVTHQSMVDCWDKYAFLALEGEKIPTGGFMCSFQKCLKML